MEEIFPDTDGLQGTVFVAQAHHHVPRVVRAAVVDEQDLVRLAHRLEYVGEPLHQLGQAIRTLVDRDDDRNLYA